MRFSAAPPYFGYLTGKFRFPDWKPGVPPSLAPSSLSGRPGLAGLAPHHFTSDLKDKRLSVLNVGFRPESILKSELARHKEPAYDRVFISADRSDTRKPDQYWIDLLAGLAKLVKPGGKIRMEVVTPYYNQFADKLLTRVLGSVRGLRWNYSSTGSRQFQYYELGRTGEAVSVRPLVLHPEPVRKASAPDA